MSIPVIADPRGFLSDGSVMLAIFKPEGQIHVDSTPNFDSALMYFASGQDAMSPITTTAYFYNGMTQETVPFPAGWQCIGGSAGDPWPE